MRTFLYTTRGGFLLVELLIYLAVTVLLSGAIVITFITLDTTLLRNRTDRLLTESARVSMERIVREIRAADSVVVAQSAINTSPGILALDSGSETFRFFRSGDNLVIEEDGVVLGPLTSSEVQVEDVVFHHYVGSATEMVRVKLTLSTNTRAASSTRTFYGSAVIRSTYD